MNSRLYVGTVAHQRLDPVQHAFTYPAHFYGVDVDELSRLDREVRGFGYNRTRPVTLRDEDYLSPTAEPVASKIRGWLKRDDVQRIELITMPRQFGYAFNPVSFYLCFDPDERIVAAAAEVNNTFGDRHLYLLDDVEQLDDGFRIRNQQPKAFHVSPFMDMEGEYRFEIICRGNHTELRIDLWRDGRLMLEARLEGSARPLTSRSLLRSLVAFPVSAFLTMPRILKQAAVLHYRKKIRVYTRPEPDHPMTLIRRPPKRFERFAQHMVMQRFERIANGRLRITLPDGSDHTYGNPMTGRDICVTVNRYRFFARLARAGEIGLGEAYTAGDFDCDDLAGLVALMIENREQLADRKMIMAWLARTKNKLGHRLRRNSRRMSRKNIEAHYDMSNEFFQTFLDPTMTYSCALFNRDDDSLEQAQVNKLTELLERARIGPEHHVLEIGSGWGSFAILAAQQTGCRVTSLTLSKEQQHLASARVASAGLSDRVTIKLCDYRDVEGAYDRIVSIEMLEAVGHAYLGTFFRRCDDLLKPDGLVVLQVITMPDRHYDVYRTGCDWIRKYIFPGGHLPSLTAMSQALANHTRLHVEELSNIGPHYATTLRAWREASVANREHIHALGWDEEGYRTWIYYLAYCEAAFATRALNTLQCTLARSTEHPQGRRALSAVAAPEQQQEIETAMPS